MADFDWPATLPQSPIVGGATYQRHDNAIRTQMEAGVAKVRRRFTAVGSDATLPVVMGRDQCEALDVFYIDTVKVVLPFNWRHFGKAGNPAAIYRFKSPPSYAPVGGDLWMVELDLEVMP